VQETNQVNSQNQNKINPTITSQSTQTDSSYQQLNNNSDVIVKAEETTDTDFSDQPSENSESSISFTKFIMEITNLFYELFVTYEDRQLKEETEIAKNKSLNELRKTEGERAKNEALIRQYNGEMETIISAFDQDVKSDNSVT